METKAKKFIKEFPNINWSQSQSYVNKLLTKLHQTSRPTVDCNHSCGKSIIRRLLKTLIQLRSWY